MSVEPGAATQRLWVMGRGGARFTLAPGQQAIVTDMEGLQPAILAVQGSALSGCVAATACDVHNLAAELDFALSDFADATFYQLFDSAGLPGRQISFGTRGEAACALLAPGPVMAPDQQNPPTLLQLIIAGVNAEAPAFLAPAQQDLHIPAASAVAYKVRQGEYIQIIDVQGKQCSDFLAFDAAALQAGQEFGLEPTVTRSLMGHAVPEPGLHSKYFDGRMRPLVEIIRDTVGRHDSFLLACTAKYYADMGYPGHANCSDNFNAALAPFGVAARPGWPALNFFYNTFVRADGSIGSDEPWSRPGDYVLLRAMTDLVCASSSCADDIDPANGWMPTDIQVRVYDKDCRFDKGVAHRMTPDAAPEMTRESGFHARTSALTRNFVEYKGFWTPACYTAQGAVAEYWACRERVACIDLSALRKFEVTGPDAEKLLQLATTRDMRKLAVGQVVYTALCYSTGGMLDDGTVFRLGAQNFRLVCGDAYCGVWLRQLAAEHGLMAWCRSSTDQLHNLAVQGPKSRDVLAEILVTPPHQPALPELGWFRFTIGRIADHAVVVSRTGYTGELGYEIWCHPSAAVAVWDAVWQAGQVYGLAPMGLQALDMLRIEAGLVFAGSEFCDQTDPFEAGIGFAVAAKKTDEFVGDAALARRRAHPQRQLVGLVIASEEDVGHGDPVFAGRAQVGMVTSAVRSPVLKQHIALARVDVGMATPGTALEIGKLDGQQKRLAAEVTRFPHYDPQKIRVRA